MGGSFDDVVYPCESTGFNQSLAPFKGGSSSCWNYDYEDGQQINWYLDSTPTPDSANNGYSAIMATVAAESGYAIGLEWVVVTGRYGGGAWYDYGDWPDTFVVGGLNAGNYFVQACAVHDTETVYATWPESVAVGYAQTRRDIRLVFGPNAVTDSRPASGRPTIGGGRQSATVVHGVLWLPPASSFRPQASSCLLDVTGRKVLDLKPGVNDVSRLSPGVYFVWSARTPSLHAMSETLHSTFKVVLTR
jgi:hypothetical protein